MQSPASAVTSEACNSSGPVPSGSPMSLNSRSNGSTVPFSNPSATLVATTTSCPRRASIRLSISAVSRWSSTSNILSGFFAGSTLRGTKDSTRSPRTACRTSRMSGSASIGTCPLAPRTRSRSSSTSAAPASAFRRIIAMSGRSSSGIRQSFSSTLATVRIGVNGARSS